ncbi:MAG: acyl-CoA/acyl-ACP dehydrogenase [Deltaproteobacteria bacterium]|nr:acyl-CoA/acyl-ACP dehydrogenase [Deltaproteobacteria bacterium]
MIHPDFDCELSEEERAVRDMVHRFAEEVMRPIGRRLDRLSAEEVIAPGSELWDVHRKWDELGIRSLAADPSAIPPEQLARMTCIIGEELGWGDAGLAVSLGAGDFPSMMAQVSQKPELIAAFPPGMLGCWAITEPDHGGDITEYVKPDAFTRLGKPNCVAKREGDFYVIRGQKAAWVSNGPVARAAALYTSLDDGGNGPDGFGVLLVDLSLAGVTHGKPLEKLGQRSLPQGEVFFDEVRVPLSHLVIAAADYPVGADLTLCMANSNMGAVFVGCARASYEMALEYARQRVQGGTPIINHQAIKLKLFEMFRKIEAARSLNRRVWLYNAKYNSFFGAQPGYLPGLHYAIASKVTSTQTAYEVATEALQVFGGNGLSYEYPVEKQLRDARASLIEDGTTEVLSLFAAERL